VQGHRVALAGLDDEVARPPGEAPLTVRDLVRHHALAAPRMLPSLVGHPVDARTLADGRGRRGAVADLVERAPKWVRRWRDGTRDAGGETHLVLDEVAAVVWVAGERAFSLCPWLSAVDAPASPRWIVLGIEPGATTAASDVALVGRLFGTALDHLGLWGGVKTDGIGGLEVWVPVRPGGAFAGAEAWAADLARSVAATVPDMVGVAPAARDRGARMRLVHRQRPAPGRVVPYGVLARASAPVSVPLAWEELDGDEPPLGPWSVRAVADRLVSDVDPWAGLAGHDQDLPAL
jgi:bifunctional non-homologous end joining protein LigD